MFIICFIALSHGDYDCVSVGVHAVIKQNMVHKITALFFQPLQPAKFSVYEMGCLF